MENCATMNFHTLNTPRSSQSTDPAFQKPRLVSPFPVKDNHCPVLTAQVRFSWFSTFYKQIHSVFILLYLTSFVQHFREIHPNCRVELDDF